MKKIKISEFEVFWNINLRLKTADLLDFPLHFLHKRKEKSSQISGFEAKIDIVHHVKTRKSEIFHPYFCSRDLEH